MSYNGWTNYETWAVALWLDNDQDSQEMVAEWAQDAWDTSRDGQYFTREEEAVRDLAQRLEDYLSEFNPLSDEPSVYSDLLNAAIGEVEWAELARHYLDEVDKADEEDEEADA